MVYACKGAYMSSPETRRRGGQKLCTKCFLTRTRKEGGVCEKCIAGEKSRLDLLARFAVPYPIPFPRRLRGVKLPCEGREDLFLTDEADQEARELCEWCPARDWCLDFGLWNDQYGTWGGLSQHERRIVKRGLRQDRFVLIA